MTLARTSAVECVWPVGAELGEGPIWSAVEQAVWFVDIKGRAIHRYHEPSGKRDSWDAPAEPGFVAPAVDGSLICGLKSGLHRFDPETGAFTLIAVVEPDAPGNRLNDGFVDACGYLWFGSMDDGESEPTGALYQLGDGGCVRRDGGYVITNGPTESPDGHVLYHTDTVAGAIYAFTRARDGALSDKRVFVRIDEPGAYPDGPIVDSEGCLWTALFGGWGLRRYSPDGRLVGELRLPCANVTKAAFGGADLSTLYITTAWKGLSAAERAKQDLAGGLFRARVNVPGLPQARVAHGL
jgi:sugar lactone lactonase YvrE